MSNGIAAEIAERGFAVVQDLFAADEMGALLEEIGRTGLPHTRAGLRHALRVPKVTTLSRDARLMSIACSVLGGDAFRQRRRRQDACAPAGGTPALPERERYRFLKIWADAGATRASRPRPHRRGG